MRVDVEIEVKFNIGVVVDNEVDLEDEMEVNVEIEVELRVIFEVDIDAESEEVEFQRGGCVGQRLTIDIDVITIVLVDAGAETVKRTDFDTMLTGDTVTTLTEVAVGVGIDKQRQACDI